MARGNLPDQVPIVPPEIFFAFNDLYLFVKQLNRDVKILEAGGGTPAVAFPVGALFLSTVATDPSTLLGYGTWELVGQGRVLVGRDLGDPDFDTLGETGGSKFSNIP